MKPKVDSIVEVIKACAEANVKVFQMGNLKIDFTEQRRTEPVVDYQPLAPTVVEAGVVQAEEIEADDLVLIDPVAWEEQMIGGRHENA